MHRQKRRRLAVCEGSGKNPESSRSGCKAAPQMAKGAHKRSLRSADAGAASRPFSRRKSSPDDSTPLDEGLSQLLAVDAGADLAAWRPAAKIESSSELGSWPCSRPRSSRARTSTTDARAVGSLLLMMSQKASNAGAPDLPERDTPGAAAGEQEPAAAACEPAARAAAAAPDAAAEEPPSGRAGASSPQAGCSGGVGLGSGEPAQAQERQGRSRTRSRKGTRPQSSDPGRAPTPGPPPPRSPSPGRGRRPTRGCPQDACPEAAVAGGGRSGTPAPPQGRRSKRPGLPPAKPCPWMLRAGATRCSGTFTVIVGWPGPRARDPVFVAAARAALADLIRRRGGSPPRSSW